MTTDYLNKAAHPKKRKDAVSQSHDDRIGNRHNSMDNGILRVGSDGLVHELTAVPDSQRERIIGVLRLVGFQTEKFGVIGGVVVLGVENGSAGLESLAGDGDGGHPTSDDGMPLEDGDLGDGVGRGVLTEEMSDGGAADAAADDADSVGVSIGVGKKDEADY